MLDKVLACLSCFLFSGAHAFYLVPLVYLVSSIIIIVQPSDHPSIYPSIRPSAHSSDRRLTVRRCWEGFSLKKMFILTI